METVNFGKYLLLERLAEGGMAVVWRAKMCGPDGFEKEFCLKQIRSELSAQREFIDLFVAEAKLTVSLTHANIVPVYELGRVDGTYFLALELIDGPPLSKLTQSGPMPPPLAAYLVDQVLRGIDYAHRRGVVHRDLSTANVLVSRDGEVKIVDFGIAAPMGEAAVRGGSRGYMSPEQEAGARVDARSDLYAVGILLWELCAGRRYDGGPLPDEVPEPLRRVVAQATAKKPADRPKDAALMLAQISRYLRDLPWAPTQAELSSHVRRHHPDLPSQDRSPSVAPSRQSGPHTEPVAGRKAKQVTFATRIEKEPRPSKRRRLYWIAPLPLVVALALVGSRRPDPVVMQRRAPATPPMPVLPVSPMQSTRGRLSVHTVPPGAEVRIGERLLGLSPLDVELLSGETVVLHLRKRGYAPVDRAFTPTFSGSPPAATVTERLIPTARGTLTLNALPWAHVTIDGEKRPDTPLKGLSVPVGPHQIRLVCPPTGRELKFGVVVEANTETTRVADLRGEPKLID